MAAQDNFPPTPPAPDAAPTHPADRVADAAPADPAPDLAALLTKAETEAADLRDAWLRAKAETDNVRKQATRPTSPGRHKFAVERFAGDLLAGAGRARADDRRAGEGGRLRGAASPASS